MAVKLKKLQDQKITNNWENVLSLKGKNMMQGIELALCTGVT